MKLKLIYVYSIIRDSDQNYYVMTCLLFSIGIIEYFIIYAFLGQSGLSAHACQA